MLIYESVGCVAQQKVCDELRMSERHLAVKQQHVIYECDGQNVRDNQRSRK